MRALIVIPLLMALWGCGYTEVIRQPEKQLRGEIIDVYPAEYDVPVLDSTELVEEYIVVESFCVGRFDQGPIARAWERDADAITDHKLRSDWWFVEDSPYSQSWAGYTITGILVKFLKNIYEFDGQIVTFRFPDRMWVRAKRVFPDGSVETIIDDEKIYSFEQPTIDMKPGIYEIQIEAGENPVWTGRGYRWKTSRWIEVR